MFRTSTLVAVALSLLSASAQDISGDLGDAGIWALFPNSDGYADASEAYNLRFDFKPAAVAFPSNADQVAQAVKIGSDNGLQVSARSGGHSYIANGLGGKDGVLVVDLSNLTSISVDSSTGIASIDTGLRLGDIALALNAAEGGSRALPHGTCPTVGIGGHAGHGGFGYTSRMWGLSLDTIVKMDVALADGSLVTASKDENPDLFWAMRGAASSFGIATRWYMQTFEAPSFSKIFSYNYNNISPSDAATILSYYATWVQTDIPPEFGSGINIFGNSDPGVLSLSFEGGWYGAEEDMQPVLDSFVNNVGVDYTDGGANGGDGTYIGSVENLGGGDLNTGDAPLPRDTFYEKSLMISNDDPLSDEAWLEFMEYLAHDGVNGDLDWFMQVELYGGSNSKINEISLDDTAFAHRDTMFTFQLYASSASYQPPYPDSGRDFLTGLVTNITTNVNDPSSLGAYLNYIDDDLDNYEQLYYGEHYERLQQLKSEYDPTGVFNMPKGVQAS